MTRDFTKTTLTYPQGADIPIKRVAVNRAPTTTDFKNFIPGDEWLDISSDDWWKFVKGSLGTSLWVKIGGTGTQVETVQGNSGGIVGPDNDNNIMLLGSGSITTVGSPSTNTLTYELTGLTNHAVLVGAGTDTITKLAIGTNGQVLLGSTGADPAFSTLTSSDGSISFTPGVHTLSIQGTQATNSQLGSVTLASNAQTEFGSYGTNQVVQAQNITSMFSSPSPIGDISSNTGAFQGTENAGTIPIQGTFKSTGTTTVNACVRCFNENLTPASVAMGFGTSIELWANNVSDVQKPLASFSGRYENPTNPTYTAFAEINTYTSDSAIHSTCSFYPTRVELPNLSTLRFGSGGPDILVGSGDPSGIVSAAQASLYLRTDGSSSSTRAYINTNGTTGWTNITTAA